MLGDKLRERGLKCTNFHKFDDITNYLIENAKTGDLILTVGAGDIYKVGECILIYKTMLKTSSFGKYYF